MKILYIHQYFKTPEEGGAIRSWHLASALAKEGHQVEMITAQNKERYEQKIINGVRVHYLPVPYRNDFGFIRRIFSFQRFAKLAFRQAKEFRDADLCYVTSTPLLAGLVAIELKKKYGIPFFFEVRDLWPEAPIQMGIIKNSFFKSTLYRLEKKLYRQAEKMIALSPGIREGILKVAPDKEVALIPNMSDCHFFNPAEKHISVLKKYGIGENSFVISYTGSLGKANRLEFLLNIAEASQKENLSLHFIIAGEGAQKEFLKDEIKGRSLKNVLMLEKGNKDLMKEILEASDATYTSFDQIPILETNSPNKFFDSLASGKLSIVNTKGWLKELVEKNECGFYADPLNPQEFLEKLKPFMEDKALLKKYQQNARRLAEREFSVDLLSKRFIQLFK
ncbi:MAG: glycosyltransferase family 4 protein [Cytophagaceae bacterium]